LPILKKKISEPQILRQKKFWSPKKKFGVGRFFRGDQVEIFSKLKKNEEFLENFFLH